MKYKKHLLGKGAVLIEGSKWCGKTTTAEQIATSVLYMADMRRLAFLVCCGGWPRAADLEGEVALEQVFDYYDAVVKSDISCADGVSGNPERVKRLMCSYARNQGAQAANTLICAERTDDDESAIADLAHSLGVNLKFTSYTKYCTREQ